MQPACINTTTGLRKEQIMIHRLAIKLVDALLKYGAAKKSRAVYIYGMECFISECIGNVLLFAVALPLRQGWMMLFWLISFLAIRVHIGGYHASTHWMCLIVSTLVGVASLPLNHLWLRLGIYSLPVLLLCDAYILFTKAVTNPKHPVSPQKARRERRRLLISAAAENVILLACFALHWTWYAPILSGMFCAVAMSLAGRGTPE